MPTASTKALIKGGSFLIEDRSPEEIFTPEDITDQHRLIRQTAREFAEQEILPRVHEIEEKKRQRLASAAPTFPKSTEGSSSTRFSPSSSPRRWRATAPGRRRWALRRASASFPSLSSARSTRRPDTSPSSSAPSGSGRIA